MTDAYIETHPTRALRAAAGFLLLSAILHLGAWLASGLSVALAAFPAVAVLYAGMALLLLRNWRWLAWPGFLCGLFGSVIAGIGVGLLPAPAVLLWGIVLADLGVAVALFVHLWARD